MKKYIAQKPIVTRVNKEKTELIVTELKTSEKCAFCGQGKAEVPIQDGETLKEIWICESCDDAMECDSSRKYYLDKIKTMGFDTSDLNKLKELFNVKAQEYKKNYKKVYMLRWGKEGEEQYSDV